MNEENTATETLVRTLACQCDPDEREHRCARCKLLHVLNTAEIDPNLNIEAWIVQQLEGDIDRFIAEDLGYDMPSE